MILASGHHIDLSQAKGFAQDLLIFLRHFGIIEQASGLPVGPLLQGFVDLFGEESVDLIINVKLCIPGHLDFINSLDLFFRKKLRNVQLYYIIQKGDFMLLCFRRKSYKPSAFICRYIHNPKLGFIFK